MNQLTRKKLGNLFFHFGVAFLSLFLVTEGKAATTHVVQNPAEFIQAVSESNQDPTNTHVIQLGNDIEFVSSANLPMEVRGKLTLEGENYHVRSVGLILPGRLFTVRDGGQLFLNHLFIEDFVSAYGGALKIERDAAAVLQSCTLQTNRGLPVEAEFPRDRLVLGNAIYNEGHLKVVQSAFVNNLPKNIGARTKGGAIYNTGGLVSLQNTTFWANRATWGGGIFSSNGRVDITASTLIGNGALNDHSLEGGGIFKEAGAQVKIRNSILQNNIAQRKPDCGGDVLADIKFSIITNVFTCEDGLREESVFSALDAQSLGRSNYLESATAGKGHFNITSESPAINRGTQDQDCPTLDQLGRRRQGSCDIGAVEFYPVDDPQGSPEFIDEVDGGPVLEANENADPQEPDENIEGDAGANFNFGHAGIEPEHVSLFEKGVAWNFRIIDDVNNPDGAGPQEGDAGADEEASPEERQAEVDREGNPGLEDVNVVDRRVLEPAPGEDILEEPDQEEFIDTAVEDPSSGQQTLGENEGEPIANSDWVGLSGSGGCSFQTGGASGNHTGPVLFLSIWFGFLLFRYWRGRFQTPASCRSLQR